MTSKTTVLIEELAELSPLFKQTVTDRIASFGSITEVPYVILGGLGRETAFLYGRGERKLLHATLERIERELESDNDKARAAAATGFLEGFWIRVEDDYELEDRQAITKILGPKSNEFLREWSEFIGAPYP